MAAHRRIALTKGVILALLLDAYRRRDRVSLTIFRDTHAELVLPPTNSVDLAEQRIRVLPTGGKTPLAGALQFATDLLRRCTQRDSSSSQLVILLTDGRANTGSQGQHPFQEALASATHLRGIACQLTTPLILVDCQQGNQRLPFVQQLSAALGANLLTLDQLAALPAFHSATPILTPPVTH
ncbi:MAG: VWA domain-containing protein [Chloroflexi bacterium]|nr:VWA domain-containing protein [Chloroflexota bacterium]